MIMSLHWQHHCHSESIVYIRVCSWCTFYGFWRYVSIILVTQCGFIAFKNPLCSGYSLLSPPMNDLFVVHIVLLLLNVIYLESHRMYPFWTGWVICISVFHHIFLGCCSSFFFFLVLNNIPLSGCTTVYLFTQWRPPWFLLSFGNYE